MTWTKKSIPAPIPEGLDVIAAESSAILSAVSPILDTAISALEAASAFIGSDEDPIQSIALVLLQELQNFNNDLFGTGVFNLVVNPFNLLGENDPMSIAENQALAPYLPNFNKTFGVRKRDQFGWPLVSPGKIIDIMQQSFDDDGDVNRPQFSESAEVCAFGFLITAPSLESLRPLMESLQAVMDLKQFENILKKLKSKLGEDPNEGGFIVPSRQPDWTSFRMNSMEPFKSIQRSVNSQIDYYEGLLTTADKALDDLTKVLTAKVTTLRTIIEDLNTILSDLTNATAASGIYLLDVPPAIGGNDYLKSQLDSEELDDLKNNNYSLGVLFVGGGPSLTTVNSIRELLT